VSPPLVEVSELRVALRAAGDYREVVRGIDMQIRRGEIVGLVGESGSGKSVTARTLIGLYRVRWPGCPETEPAKSHRSQTPPYGNDLSGSTSIDGPAVHG